MKKYFFQAVQLRAMAGVRSRAAFVKPTELFKYLNAIVKAQNVDLVNWSIGHVEPGVL